MNIGIFGSTGFIGRNLLQFLSQEHTVVEFNRADLELETGLLGRKMESLYVIINLIGAPILGKR